MPLHAVHRLHVATVFTSYLIKPLGNLPQTAVPDSRHQSAENIAAVQHRLLESIHGLGRFIGVYPIGGRYGLVVLPLFFMLLAAAVVGLRRWPVAAYGLGLLLVGLQLFFWPQFAQSLNPWLELPRESLRPTVDYLNEQAKPEDVVYVYYGAGPAYRVYQMDSPLETVYGTWFRQLPMSEKMAEIHEAVGDAPRFWLAMSHIHEAEDEELLQALVEGTPEFTIIDQYEAENAAVYLLQRAGE